MRQVEKHLWLDGQRARRHLARALLLESQGRADAARRIVRRLADHAELLGPLGISTFPDDFLMRGAARLDAQAFIRICERRDFQPVAILGALIGAGQREAAKRMVADAAARGLGLARVHVQELAGTGAVEDAIAACEHVGHSALRAETLAQVVRGAPEGAARRAERILAIASRLEAPDRANVLLELALASEGRIGAEAHFDTRGQPPMDFEIRRATLYHRIGCTAEAARLFRAIEERASASPARALALWDVACGAADAGFEEAAARISLGLVALHAEWLDSMISLVSTLGIRRERVALRLSRALRLKILQGAPRGCLGRLRRLAGALADLGAYRTARRTLLLATVAERGRRELAVEGWLLCAERHRHAGETTRARACLRKAERCLRVSTAWMGLADTTAQLARALCGVGLFRRSLRVAASVSPDCPEQMRLEVAMERARRGKPTQLIRMGTALPGDSPRFLDAMRALVETGRGRRARKIARSNGAGVKAWLAMAEAHALRGEQGDAARCLLWATE